MAEKKETAKRRPRRSEAEKAQAQYEKVRAKWRAKEAQRSRLYEEYTRVSEELNEVEELLAWWASNPLVDTLNED